MKISFTKSVDYFDYINALDNMCDDYCYYKHTSTDPDVLEQHCKECPMANLIKSEVDEE